jgi:hypothetical protein
VLAGSAGAPARRNPEAALAYSAHSPLPLQASYESAGRGPRAGCAAQRLRFPRSRSTWRAGLASRNPRLKPHSPQLIESVTSSKSQKSGKNLKELVGFITSTPLEDTPGALLSAGDYRGSGRGLSVGLTRVRFRGVPFNKMPQGGGRFRYLSFA